MFKSIPASPGFTLFFFVLLFLAGGSRVASQVLQPPYENSHFIEVDSVSFHFRTWNENLEHPKGKILLVHGFCGSTFCWRNNFDTLAAAGYKVIAVDLPGFGYSDRSGTINQSQSNRAFMLWSLLRSIDNGDTAGWNIVGHSMGGGTVEAMALLHPERTRSLTIVDGMVFIRSSDVQGAFVTLSKNKEYNKFFVSLVEKEVFTYNMIAKLVKKNYRYMPDSCTVMGYLSPLLIDGSAECFINVWSNASETVHLKACNFHRIPTLVIWGKNDRTINLSTGKRFVRNVPWANLVVIPNAGHDPMETTPAEFNGILARFLEETN
jgi:2-hydroxy-6-oxonona-2,4-dienedioate hydrolase